MQAHQRVKRRRGAAAGAAVVGVVLACVLGGATAGARAAAGPDASAVAPGDEAAPAEEVGAPEVGGPAPPDGPATGAAPVRDESVVEPATLGALGAIDRVHGTISRSILGTARWLDSFFDDPRFAAEENRTRVKIDLDYFAEHGSGPEFNVPVAISLRLPQFQNRTRLVFVGTPDQELEGTTRGAGTAADRLPTAQDENFTTAVDYFFRATDRRNVAMRVGLRLRDGEPELFVQPRYRVLVPLNPWALRFTQQFRWWTEFGWEETTTLDLERPVGEDLFFRTSLQGAWTEQENGYFYSLGFTLRQPLSPRRVLQYELINNFETRPVHQLDEIRAVVRYRQKIWRDWLFYEIAPQLSSRRERDFDPAPGILFRLEMIFGHYQGAGV
jgi:hypothetical protein